MNDKVKSFKVGDKVKIVSAPLVENNEYGQSQIDNSVGKETVIYKIHENGIRNIECAGNGVYNYYSPENLKLQSNEQ